MKRSSVWISILMALLMFQSLWNVAAAFCVHKMPIYMQEVSHFGHHVDVYRHVTTLDDSEKINIWTPYVQQMNLDDHRDHLPSFAHIVLQDNIEPLSQTQLFLGLFKPFFDWHNLYQSPHLYGFPPPPMLTPLLVG